MKALCSRPSKSGKIRAISKLHIQAEEIVLSSMIFPSILSHGMKLRHCFEELFCPPICDTINKVDPLLSIRVQVVRAPSRLYKVLQHLFSYFLV